MSTRAMRIGAIVFFGSFLALAVWGLGTGVGDRDLHIIAIIMNSMFLLRSLPRRGDGRGWNSLTDYTEQSLDLETGKRMTNE